MPLPSTTKQKTTTGGRDTPCFSRPQLYKKTMTEGRETPCLFRPTQYKKRRQKERSRHATPVLDYIKNNDRTTGAAMPLPSSTIRKDDRRTGDAMPLPF